MGEENRESSALDTAAKAGRLASSISKGAASGGPFGAAVGAMTANNGAGLKVLLAGIGLLLLPVLFLLMLPGLIFGGLADATAPGQSAPILNDSVAIYKNVSDISFMLNSVLREGQADVLERIDKDFARTSADGMEIVNPYENDIVCNANMIVSQYCAACEENFSQISLDDLERILLSAKRHLYNYTKVYESRQVTVTSTVTDPETGETSEVSETVTEIWVIYTVQYNGEAYLGDTVFHLTTEQKDLAAEYARNMSTFLGDGMFQGLLPGEFILGESYEGVVLTSGGRDVVYYNQMDERFANEAYGTDNIGYYGCGPTAMAIVVSTLTNETVDPIQMAAWSYQNGGWCSKSGSYHTLIPKAAEHWGLPWEGATPADAQRIVDALAEGRLVVAIMGPGAFTRSGHFIVLRAVSESGKILVADPASYKRSQKEWDLELILNQASKNAAAAQGPFWIIG